MDELLSETMSSSKSLKKQIRPHTSMHINLSQLDQQGSLPVTTYLVGSSSRIILKKTNWVDGSRNWTSWSRRTVMDFVIPCLWNFFCCSPHYPRRQVGRTVIGTTVRRASSFQNTSNLKYGYLDQLSELHDGIAA